MLDEILKWTGWLLAVGMVIWKVTDTVRNRPAIKFFIGLSKEENFVNLTVINVGRRPVNLIRAGLQYPDGCSFDFPSSLNVYLGWFYNMQPRINRLDLKYIKDFVSEQDAPTMVKFIYFTAENGDRYRVKIPSHIRDELYS